MIHLQQPTPARTVGELSKTLTDALQELIRCAGGWETRSTIQRPAYESPDAKRFHGHLRLLGTCSTVLHRESGLGSFSRQLTSLIADLHHRGLDAPTSSRWDLQQYVDSKTIQ